MRHVAGRIALGDAAQIHGHAGAGQRRLIVIKRETAAIHQGERLGKCSGVRHGCVALVPAPAIDQRGNGQLQRAAGCLGNFLSAGEHLGGFRRDLRFAMVIEPGDVALFFANGKEGIEP